MTLIVQIVLGLLVLVGLATIIMSSKNWHWTQLVLVLSIFFAAIGVLFLGADTLRIHKNLRTNIPRLEKQLTSYQKQNKDLLNGTGDQLGILELDHRLQIVARERGRVWRGVVFSGQVDPQGRVTIEINKPSPHGLEQDAILYAFEAGNPNMADPASGAQYLGEFRVAEVQAGGAMLDPILLIDKRAGQRLAASERPWSLYETMPIDRHRLFAGRPEAELRAMLPAESAEEYLRHGTKATDDDDQWHVTGLDEDGQRVGPDNIDSAVKRLYDRSLRDYAFIFNQLASEKVVALAKQRAVTEDNTKLDKALAGAKKTGLFRQRQLDSFSNDLAGMKQDRTAIESLSAEVRGLLQNFQQRIEIMRQTNSDLARQFTEQQLGMVMHINQVAPAPATFPATSPFSGN